MMDGNCDLMKVLVSARQDELRRIGKPVAGGGGLDVGALRKSMGTLLIRAGERLAGAQAVAPPQTKTQGRLAMP